MNKIAAMVLALALALVMTAYTETTDLSGYTDEQLTELSERIAREREAREAEKANSKATTDEVDAAAIEDAQDAPTTLTVGKRGKEVIALQNKLNELGFSCGLVDGSFGPKTKMALQALQTAMGQEATGIVEVGGALDAILALQKGDGVNLVWDGQFKETDKYWRSWGSPIVCEIVEIDGKNWMHLVSSGAKYEGLHQDVSLRSGVMETAEMHAGKQYTFSVTAFGTKSADKVAEFRCGIHSRALDGSGINQEQYWTPTLELGQEARRYTYTFTPTVDGTFNVMIGTGNELAIEAWFTDIKIETGNIATLWSENPNIT